MGRFTLNHLLNSSGTATIPTSHTVELFRIGTYCTATEAANSTVPVGEAGELSVGDQIYIGTGNAGLHTTINAIGGDGLGPETVTVDDSVAFSNNDSVVVKRKNGAGADSYANVYDDPDYVTELLNSGGAALALDSNGEYPFYVRPGRYGVRVANASGVTVDLQHDVSFEETIQALTRTTDDNMSLAIEAWVRAHTGGGTLYVPEGTYDLDTTCDIATAGIEIVGAGAGTIFRITIDDEAFIFTAAHCALRNCKVMPTTANSTGGVVSASANADYFTLENVWLDQNAIAHTGWAITVSGADACAVRDCRIYGASGSFAYGIDAGLGTVITGNLIDGCSIDGVRIIAAGRGVFIAGNKISNNDTGVAILAGATDYTITGNYWTGNSNTVSDLNTTGAVAGVTVDTNVTVQGNLRVANFLRLDNGTKDSETIATGVITAASSMIELTGEGAVSDTLTTINGGTRGNILILSTVASAQDITLDELDNLKLGASTRVLDNLEDRIVLISDGTSWYELAFANNGA